MDIFIDCLSSDVDLLRRFLQLRLIRLQQLAIGRREPIKQMIETRLDPFKKVGFIFCAFARPNQFIAADAWPWRRRTVGGVLRFLMAVTFGTEVGESLIEIRKLYTGIHRRDALLSSGNYVVVKLLHAPGKQAFFYLFGKAIGIGGGDDCFAGENARSLVMSVAVA